MIAVPTDLTYPGHPPGSPLRVESKDLFLEPMTEPVYKVLEKLESRYRRPLRGVHIVHEGTVQKNLRRVQAAFRARYGGAITEAWAVKSFHVKALVGLAALEGAGADAGSLQELEMALEAGMSPGMIICTGPAKDDVELDLIAGNEAICVIDSLSEAEALNRAAGRTAKRLHVGIRVIPSLPGEMQARHPGILTATRYSQFGVPVENDHALKMARQIHRMESLRLSMVHMHIGTQITDLSLYREAVESEVDFVNNLREEGIEVTMLDVGGGFGFPYVPRPVEERLRRAGIRLDLALACELTPEDYAEAISEAVRGGINGELPTLFIEPGRYVVAGACGTLGRVLTVKEFEGIANWVHSTISTREFHHKLVAPSLLYQAGIANRMDKPADFAASLGGELCFRDDVMLPSGVAVLVPKPKRGDYIYFANTGAYSIYGAANSHNIPRLPIVMVTEKAEVKVIRAPERRNPMRDLDRMPTRILRELRKGDDGRAV